MAKAKALIWPRVEAAVLEICGGDAGPLLDRIGAIEGELDRTSFAERVGDLSGMDHRIAGELRIRDFSDGLADTFYRLNAEWIERMFTLEESDRAVLSRPREEILDRGGVILFVEAVDLGVVGTCALKPAADGRFEVTKMAVTPAAQGRKAGEFLLKAVLARAEAMGIEHLFLLTNKRCAAAIHLYEKLGFVHDADIMREHGSDYARCNVAMRFQPKASAGKAA
jgi:N-acetylglutamate synthase-like GNAT family acetyltransferase